MPRDKKHARRDAREWWTYSSIPSKREKPPAGRHTDRYADIGGGWSRHHCPSTGQAYYFHAQQLKSQWARPAEVPEEPEQQQLPFPFVHRGANTRQGRAYYENLQTKEWSYERPPWDVQVD